MRISGADAKITMDEMNFTTSNDTCRKKIQSSIPIQFKSMNVLPCNGHNTEFSNNIAKNNININFATDSSEYLIPDLYGNGINSSQINVIHRKVTHNEMSLLCNVSCLWNFKGKKRYDESEIR